MILAEADLHEIRGGKLRSKRLLCGSGLQCFLKCNSESLEKRTLNVVVTKMHQSVIKP